MRLALVAFALVVISAGLAPPAHAAAFRTLELRRARTGETVRLGFRVEHGRIPRRVRARVAHLLASPRSGPARIHPRLVAVLAHLHALAGRRPIVISSGYRGPADPGGPHGYHGAGRAADLRIQGVDARDVFDRCRRLRDVGCGLYPAQHFVHVDVRPRPSVWVDLSTGQGSRYVKGVDAWLAAHPDAGCGPATSITREPAALRPGPGPGPGPAPPRRPLVLAPRPPAHPRRRSRP